MIFEIDGSKIRTEADFHEEIKKVLRLGPYYGKNLDALWDALTRDLERPVSLVWKNVNASRRNMPSEYDKIVRILREVEEEDAVYAEEKRFKLITE